MHDTALKHGAMFFETYASPEWGTVVEVGAMDVNGSLRSACPPNITYLGVDMEHGKSVDIIVKPGEPLPFRDGFCDAVISSSQLEHDDFFWLSFLEFARVIKPGGYVYINAPSNGAYHRYPNDNWRFYPDCGQVLARWAQRNGIDIHLIESFVADLDKDIWCDFCAVFRKGPEEDAKEFMADKTTCRNIWKLGRKEPENFRASMQDMETIRALEAELNKLRAQV